MSEHPGPEQQGENADNAWPEKKDSWEAADREWEAWWDEWEDPPSFQHSEAGESSGEPANGRPASTSPAKAYLQGMREAGPHLTLGYQIAGTMVFFVAGGYFLDRWLDSSPWGIIGGATLAFVAILMLVIRLANTADAKKDEATGRR